MGKTEFIGVQCFQCNAFQVAQQTKTNKWSCKICNSKQTVRKVYAISYQAKDIRPIVQELNMKRGEKEKEGVFKDEEQEDEIDAYSFESNNDYEQEEVTETKPNKWSKYIPQNNDTNDDEDDDPNIVTVMPEKKRTRKKNTENNDEPKQTRGKKRKIFEQDDEEEEMPRKRQTRDHSPPPRAAPVQRQSVARTYEEQPVRQSKPTPIPRQAPTKPPAPVTSSKWGKFTTPAPSASKWSKFTTSSAQEEDEDDNVITDASAFYGQNEEYL